MFMHARPYKARHSYNADLDDLLAIATELRNSLMANAADYQAQVDAFVVTLDAARGRLTDAINAQSSTLDLSALSAAVDAVSAIVPVPVAAPVDAAPADVPPALDGNGMPVQ